MISFVSIKIVIKLFCLVMSPTFQYHIEKVDLIGSLSKDSLHADDKNTLISTVCEAAQRSLFWTPSGLNELPEVRFEFPFNLIGDHDKQNKGLF